MTALFIGFIFAIASIWLPHSAVDPMARIVVPAIALLATSIFPCMSLAVGSLKAEQRAPLQVDELYDQLRTIMKVLVVTFALAATAVATIVGLSGLVASYPESLTKGLSAAALRDPIEVSCRALLIVICFAIALLGGRIVAVGKAFFAILDINRKHALLVARSRVQGEREMAMDQGRKHMFVADDSTPRAMTG